MRIVVCVKQTYDPKTVRASRSREELDLRDAVKITNPTDRCALEAGLRLRSALGGEVVAVTVGDAAAEDTAHEAVAIGADRALLVQAPELAAAGGGAVARGLAAAVGRLQPVDLVLTGAADVLGGSGALAPRLAAVLDWPVLLEVMRLAPDGDGGLEATIVDGQVALAAALPLPAVLAILPGPERPRYPHAARIANAWRAGLVEVCTAADLGLESLEPELETGGLVFGPERKRGQVLPGEAGQAADRVLDLLREKRVL